MSKRRKRMMKLFLFLESVLYVSVFAIIMTTSFFGMLNFYSLFYITFNEEVILSANELMNIAYFMKLLYFYIFIFAVAIIVLFDERLRYGTRENVIRKSIVKLFNISYKTQEEEGIV